MAGKGKENDAPSEAQYFVISVAAQLAGMHAQTLRTYDRLGLVIPQRTPSGGRRYSQNDVELLREVQRLSQDDGVNLAGIKRVIELTNQVAALEQRVAELTEELERLRRAYRPDAELMRPGTALVVWRPRNQR
jgi:MerR family transcriptional regulator, heat shock protein HspR